MNQRQLIRECKQGSVGAQKCLFDHFAESMMSVCCRYVKNEQDAEEVLLDGFYKFFKSIATFQYQGEAALFTWIKRIMINESLMFLRKKKIFLVTVEAGEEQIPVPDDMLDKLSAGEIVKLIMQLPVGYRTVFNLYVIEGLGHKEIAGLLDITEGTSKSQLSKAKQLLQKMLVQQSEEYGNRKIK
jgi:RNA polymerase sigma factor (sigma-70 family)